MSYALVIERAAQKSLTKISPPHQDRVIYEIHENEVMVLVVRVRHRREAYR